MIARTLGFALVVGGLAVCLAGQAGTRPDSVERLVDLLDLPRLTPGVVCRQFASTDPLGKGDDHGHYLRRDGDRAVLAEMDGPGVIVRLWSANAAGRLRVYLDGEDEPRLDCAFASLFDGSVAPFVPPIATRQGGGSISYFPIPYSKSCRVEVHELEQPAALYYQVQYLTYPRDTSLRTFTRDLPDDERRALDDVLRRWRAPGPSPTAPAERDREVVRELHVGAGSSAELFVTDEPGTVLTLRLRPHDAEPEALRELQLVASWDGAEESIRVPLGDLFGVAFGSRPYRGLAVGWDDRGGYLHLPMPFRSAAHLAVRNVGARDRDLSAALVVRPGMPPADAGALHAEFRELDGVGAELYEFASITGPGKFVGRLQALQGVGDLWYLEGNDEWFADGEATPRIRGTGTEDDFNGGWYWEGGPLTLPLHGLGVKQEWTTNRTTPWRIQVPDAVPFASGLIARTEHGSVNEVRDAYYSSVALWYASPRGVRAVPASASRLPRLWVVRPPGFAGAASLAWDPRWPIEWRTWDEVSRIHRGLERPLFQAFPRSHVEHGAESVDARLAMLAEGPGERIARARVTIPFADRFRAELRICADDALPEVRIDGRRVDLHEADAPGLAPLRRVGLHAGPLEAGDHELEFRATTHAAIGLDALRWIPISPFVRTWRIGPAVPAMRDGTVEDPVSEEATYLAPGFDPGTAGWRAFQSTGDGIDLAQEVSGQGSVLAYLMVFVHSETARTAHVMLGSDDGVRVWVNGALHWSHDLHRPVSADEDQFDVPLSAGWNRVLVKVKNDYGGFGLQLRIADPDGTLRVSNHER